MLVNLKKQAQIEVKAKVRALIFDKAPTIILIKYSNYRNVFLVKYIAELLENIKINEHTIKLEESK